MKQTKSQTWQVAGKPRHEVKPAAGVLAVFASPVKVNQLQHFTVQKVGKEVETSHVKILHITAEKVSE